MGWKDEAIRGLTDPAHPRYRMDNFLSCGYGLLKRLIIDKE